MAAILVLLVTACTAPTRYMGIAFADAPPSLAATARAAAGGDKRAQYDLGLRFETGDGVARDERRAMRLYRLAGSDSGGTMFVYSPPVGKEKTGRVIPISSPKVYGIPAARSRLAALKRRAGD